jgi:GntR family transcriptional regulator
MKYIHLNKFLSTPLYIQLKDSIRKAILSNELKDNDQLPTEASLCSIFNISRPVVRQAYNELIKEGLLTRIQGKGSFVNKKIMITNLMYTLNGYATEVEKLGLIPESTIISIEIDQRDNLPFELQQANQEFYLVKRVRKASGIPLFLEYFYLPRDKFANFENLFADNAQFSKLMKDTYGYKELEIKTSMSAMLADDILADILEIEKGQPLFRFVVITHNKYDDLYAYKLSFFPGDRHKLEIIEKGEELYGIYKD